MKKLGNLKFVNIFLIAVLILNQVILLFLLTAPINAETEINTTIADEPTTYTDTYTTPDTQPIIDNTSTTGETTDASTTDTSNTNGTTDANTTTTDTTSYPSEEYDIYIPPTPDINTNATITIDTPTKDIVTKTRTRTNNSDIMLRDINTDDADIYKQINITVDNSATLINNNVLDTKITNSTASYKITFMEAYQPPFSGEKRITVSLNKNVSGVDFSIEGPGNEKYSGVQDKNRQYYFMWDTPNFPNGYYRITANAWVAGTIKASRSLSTRVMNNGTSVDNLLTPTQPITSKIIKKRPLPMMPQVQPELLPECKKNNITSIEECQRFINIPPECREKNIFSQKECYKFKSIPPECRDNGLLSQEECNKYMSTSPECREKGITNKEECQKHMQQYSMPIECQGTRVATQEECNNIIFLKSLPDECKRAGVTNKEECEKILRIQAFLTPECEQAKITNIDACNKYMEEKFMAPECKQAGATTMEECNYILREKVSDLNVLVKIEVKTEQETEIKEVELPEECQQAGASSAEECIIILFKKNAPQECLDAGISTSKECEKFMFKKSAPTDCKEAGISTPEACKKYMFEKYGDAEKIPADKLPLECQKAGASTAADCDKIMRKMYLPRECQDQGITDGEKCELYIQQKNMSKECQDAGAKTRSECDKIMFKKYGPNECITAGIEDDIKCQDFMFNKYAPQVTCQGIDDWQCKNSIKERHIGNIVAKQVQYQELEEKMAHLAGESVTQKELTANLDVSKGMMPLKEGEANFKVLGMEGKLTLDDGDNLIQTSPVALMIDSDQDGLPDNMEKRLGTDPQKPDTDGDGYDDGAEVKNNYNPSGKGKLGNVLSPIEEAIMANKKLGQPKSEGEISRNLAVETISNISGEEEENQGYLFTGKAEPDSIATLYFYSDLPLITTVKTDEYGNWQYEFKESLIEGEHEVYVAINDNTGKITTKSNPLSFFIKEAKATSVKDFVSTAVPITPQTDTENLVKYYIIIAALIVIMGILLFVAFIIQKKKTQP